MTTFQTPLKTQGAGGDTGNSQTETSGFVHSSKVISLGATGTAIKRAVVSIPPFSTLTGLRAIPTSAFVVNSDVSALNVSWGNSADATHYGIIAVSALGALRTASVSAGTEFDNGGTVVVVVSAVSTTTFNVGGVRAFIEYVTVG